MHFQEYEPNPANCRLLRSEATWNVIAVYNDACKIRSRTTQAPLSREITFMFKPFAKELQSFLFAFGRNKIGREKKKKRRKKKPNPELQYFQQISKEILI